MEPLMWILLFLAVVVGAGLGRLTAPKPVAPPPPPPPEPQRFGLDQVEEVKAALGGLSQEQAQAAQVAAVVGRMRYTVPEDVKLTRETLAAAVSAANSRIEEMRNSIKAAERNISRANERDAEVAAIGSAFGVV